jgi:hypothetical protein
MEEWRHPDVAAELSQREPQQEGPGRLPTAQERAEASRAQLHKQLGDDMRAQIAKGMGWDDLWRALRLGSAGIATEGGVPFNPGAYEPEPFSLPGVAQSRNPLNAAGDRFIMQEVTPIPGAWLSKYGKQAAPPEPEEVKNRPRVPFSALGDDPTAVGPKPVPGYKMAHEIFGRPTVPTWRHMFENPTGPGGVGATVGSWLEPALMELALLAVTRGTGPRGLGMGTSIVEQLSKKPPQ